MQEQTDLFPVYCDLHEKCNDSTVLKVLELFGYTVSKL